MSGTPDRAFHSMMNDEHMAVKPPTMEDRLAARQRPGGWPVMHQSWDKLIFINWEISAGDVRRSIPQPLGIDTFDGKAWITITPLTIYDVRPPILPAVPYLSWLHELNLRTYVYHNGVPGVWFFSLDANNLPAVLGARLFFELPYFSAEINMGCTENEVSFSSKRSERNAEFTAKWAIGSPLPSAEPGSLEFFLAERYSLYTADTQSIYKCRINHAPWPLQTCEDFSGFRSSIANAAGLPEPDGTVFEFCGGPVHVDVWPLEKVAEISR
jgi:uncharacterized protein YqjF (DUF2071 family)